PAVLAVTSQIEVGPVGDTLELGPAEGKLVLDVDAPLGVVRQLVGAMRSLAQPFARDREVEVPAHPLRAPVVEALVVLPRADEVLELHLLELPRAEEEVPGGDLVAERAADLRDAEGQLQARGLEHVPEVDEGALRGLGSEVGDVRGVLDRAD